MVSLMLVRRRRKIHGEGIAATAACVASLQLRVRDLARPVGYNIRTVY
jgi:hypothetical protein